MSFIEKNPYSSSYIDKKESISEQDSPRRLKVALKYFGSDEKIHNDSHSTIDACTNNHIETTEMNEAAAVNESVKSFDGIVPKDDDERFCFDTDIFRVYCKCTECLQYREVLIQLVLEDHEYNTLWDRLKALIREFYDVIPQNPVPYENSMDAKYEELINMQAKWFTDGHIDKQKNIQLSLSSQLPLTNEMTFILVFTMLYTRDPHQLFQLLCIQLRCISIAYSDGLKKMLTTNGEDETPTYNPVELLIFILDGYDKFCNTAKKLSSLLIELQRDHLKGFSLTWTILNKRMYQRYVYMEIQDLIPECIIKLKDLLEPEEYSTMAHRLIRFDEDMTSTTKNWSQVWSLLQEFHMELEDTERRKRISCIQDLLKAIRDCEFDFSPYEKLLKRENSEKMQWIKMENRDEAWVLTVDYLKRVWQEKDDSRLYASVRNEQCITCDSELGSHYTDCDCVTCLFAGGPCSNQGKEVLEKFHCTKCSFYDKLDYMDYIKKDINKRLRGTSDKSLPNTDDDLDDEITLTMLENHCYHLSWAVFKHMPLRKVYNVTNFNARHFCSFQDPPCMRNECRVATHIIAGLYPLNFSKFLIKAYQPLKEEERKELMNIQKLYFSYLMQKISDDKSQKVDMLQQMDLLWNIDDAEYTLFCDIGSAFAECYLIDMPIPVQELLDSCFILDNDNGDIELNTYWLECIYMFKESDNSPLKKIENDPKVLEFQLRMQMDQINSMSDVGKFSAATTKLLTTTKLLEVKSGKLEKNNDIDTDELEFARIRPESYEKLKALLDVVKHESKNEKKCDDNLTKECSHNSTVNIIKTKKTISINSSKASGNASSPTPFRETKCKKHDICDKEDDSTFGVNDAVKIRVKQQLNQKLEAELKSLKKEHSVLKDMVRDLEQIKENDDSQSLAKKEKGNSSNNGAHHCCSEHSDLLDNQQNHPKMCHRGDGQCTCYYCTIFGHTECNHGRTNETRDRLRKRLHQIHSKSSTKTITTKTIKNPPGALKKMLASKVTATNSSAGASGSQCHILPSSMAATASTSLLKPVVEQKENSTNEILEAALRDDLGKVITANNAKMASSKPSSSNSNTATANTSTINVIDPKTAKKRKIILSNSGGKVEHTGDCCDTESCDEKNKHRSETTASNSDADSSLTRKTKPTQQPANDFASLDDILDFIEGNTTNKKDSQKKAAKKAKQKQKKEDVKRIEELEQLRDQFHDAFFKELDVKNDLKSLRSMKKRDKKKISELDTSIKKYGKYKAKIESNILELIGVLKANNADFKFAYLPTKEQQLEKQQQDKQQQTTQGNQPVIAEVIGDQVKAQQEKSNNVRLIQNDQRQETCEYTLDQSKRMVTIRRINVPHAEPQVTVTAKGISPDKDKLLYTFINGQLIPSTSVASQAQSQQQTASVSSGTSDKVTKSKQNVKAEPKVEAKSSKKPIEPTMPDKNTKKNAKEKQLGEKNTTKANDKTSGRKTSPENTKPSTSKSTKTTTNTNTAASTKDKDKKQKKGKKDIDTEVDSITNSTKELTINEEKPKKEKKKVKAIKFEYADPNYKVNQFDLLDMDEDDDYYIESSSDESIENEPVPVPKPTVNVTKLQTPTLSHQSSVESQPAQPVQPTQPTQTNKNNKNQQANKNAKAIDTGKKGKNDSNAKAQPQKADKKPSTESNTAPSAKSQKLSNNQAQHTNVPTNKQSNVDDSNLSKKQKKKLEKKLEKKQQNTAQVQQQPNTARSSSRADADFHSMSSSMQRMRLDSDASDATKNQSPNTSASNVSIMDQLNRGVKVEGLMLPPGITLTRVDPQSAEGMRAKKEAISRISQPVPQQYQQPLEYQRPPQFISGMSMQPNGLIMVDPMQNLASSSSTTDQNAVQTPNSKKNRKNRKKNKNKAEEESVDEQTNLVTLRNPLFTPGDPSRTQPPAPVQQRNQMAMGINQPASITKNDNGMFTIRNMALQQALSNGAAPNYRLYPNDPIYQPQEMNVDNYSYFSGNTASNAVTNPNNSTNPTSASSVIGQEVLQSSSSPKASATAIGSERSLRKQQQSYASMNGGDMYNSMHMDQKRPYSSFDVNTNYGFNSDFIGQNNPAIQQQNQYYQHVNGGFPYGNQTQTDNTTSLFGSRTQSSLSNAHCCDDTPPTHDPYRTKTDDSSFFKKFDDDSSFLHGLHPGQRLNSEVTIHNINDPKFNRKPASLNLRDGVEITRINGPDGGFTNPNLAVGSQRPTSSSIVVAAAAAAAAVNDDLNNSANSEFGENVFVPNSAVNLSELETDEREIESFKRFNYYYEPPKNKPKVNLDVKGIVVAKKQPASNNSSPYFGELAGSSLSNTPRLDDDLYPELNAFKSNSGDPTIDPTTRIQLDNFLHGIIGDDLKTDHN